MTLTIPNVIKLIVSQIEKFGKAEAKEESVPIVDHKGVFQRVVAGYTKADDHGNQKIYGVTIDAVGVENDSFLVTDGERRIYFAGKLGVSTLKKLHDLVDAVIKFQREQVPNLTLEQAIEWVIDRFNHAWNIQQRTNYRLSQSYSTGTKPINDLTREGVKTIPAEVLLAEYKMLIDRLNQDILDKAEEEAEETG